MIRIENLNKNYNDTVTALKDINVSIKKGEIFGIIGKSGAGKTTLLHSLNLLEKPTTGHIFIAGVDITTLSEKALREQRRKIGMIFQHFNLLSSKNVFENIALPLKIAGKDKETIEKTVTPLLELVGLSDKRNVYPSQLSGGQKQRVAIARALTNNPEVLLCDEATSALDPQTTQSILTLLRDINRKMSLTIVLITHQMSVVKEVCDRVAVLNKGCIVELGDVSSVFTNPKETITRDLIHSSSFELSESSELKERTSL